MNVLSSTCAVLFAAGNAQRFGSDKLLAKLDGEAIVARAAAPILALPFAARAAIVRDETSQSAQLLARLGFILIENAKASEGIGTSLACGARYAAHTAAEMMLVALGDMPFVTQSHLAAIVERASSSARGLSFTMHQLQRSPPAAFDRQWFAKLGTVAADEGARAIISNASPDDAVEAPAGILKDIDTTFDLDAAQEFEKSVKRRL